MARPVGEEGSTTVSEGLVKYVTAAATTITGAARGASAGAATTATGAARGATATSQSLGSVSGVYAVPSAGIQIMSVSVPFFHDMH